MENYTADILNSICESLVTGPVMVQETCVSAIMSISQSVAGATIEKYYDSIMPVLKQLLIHAESNRLEILWGQVLECCAIIGEAAGPAKFHADSLEMMRLLSGPLQQLTEESNIRCSMLRVWVSIA